jgi:thiol-disulfide isomerase/thioredoxin
MKPLFLKVITSIILSVLILSCDFIQNANPPIEPSTAIGTSTNVIYRKTLVEDYTGHKCGNCPAAADVLKTLETQYAGKIVPIAIHAGFFSNTNATYPTDFKTTAGTAYDTQFGISTAGNPNGLVNRVGYGTGGFIKGYTGWSGEINQQINQLAKFQIKIKNTFNNVNNNLNTVITVKSLVANNGNYKLVILLTEDSVIAEQLDYRLPTGSQTKLNYEFNHVLRGAINSEWGDDLFLINAAINDSVIKTYSNFKINTNFNTSKCHVVAYIYDSNSLSPTYYEVLQVEEETVK